MLVGMSRSKRHRVMASLANLTKYLGCYDYWRSIVKNAGLRWDKRSGVEAFLSIVNTDLREVERWLRNAIRKLPRKHSATLVFQALTGVRPSEACKAVSLMAELDGTGELEKYFNRELSMLEHFRFPKLFLRRSKNCYISFVSEDVLGLVLRAVREKVTYAAMVQVIQSRGLPIRMLQLRKLYATTLRERGVTKEIIDLLQGRIGQSIFLRHYYKPYLSQVKTKVLEAMEKLANELTITLN
jgi:intergrase/recombinase